MERGLWRLPETPFELEETADFSHGRAPLSPFGPVKRFALPKRAGG